MQSNMLISAQQDNIQDFMKAIALGLAIFVLGCSSPIQNRTTHSYGGDYRTVFQASLSALKDCKFTIKSYDWNSGEIEGYKTFGVREKQKPINATISIEQVNSAVKVRISLTHEEKLTSVSQFEFISVERQFFQLLDAAMKVPELRQ
jgi:hypothetical protein